MFEENLDLLISSYSNRANLEEIGYSLRTIA